MEEKNTLFAGFPPVTTEAWEAQIQIDLKGADYEKKLIWNTYEGIPVRPYYREENTKAAVIPGMPDNWEIRQDIEEESIAEINALACEISKKGAEGLGLDCSHVRSQEDLETLLSGINPEQIALHFRNSSNFIQLFEWFIAWLKIHKYSLTKVRGSLGYAPLDTLPVEGELRETSWKETALTLLSLAQELPGFRVITISGNLFHEAGSTLTQELGYALSMAHEYVHFLKNTSPVKDIARSVQIELASGSNYFLEIAKFRAARILWANMLSEYGEHGINVVLAARTSRWNKTLYDPYVNMLRSTTESMAAALGGANIILTEPFDIVFRKPDIFSMRMARNQQILLKEESWLNKVADPSAGSYYIENLTQLLCEYAWNIFREVEQKEGFIQQFTDGKIQEAIEKVAQQRLKDIATRKTIVLGTNQYPNALERIEQEGLQGKPERRGKGLHFMRLAGEFESMRMLTEAHAAKTGKNTTVFLFTIGNLAMRKARAMFSANFFGCAGFTVLDNPGFSSVSDGFRAWKTSGAEIIVLCSSDEEYTALVPELGHLISAEAKKPFFVLAGFPKEQIEAFKQSGVDDFIHVRSNVLETLTAYQQKLGIHS